MVETLLSTAERGQRLYEGFEIANLSSKIPMFLIRNDDIVFHDECSCVVRADSQLGELSASMLGFVGGPAQNDSWINSSLGGERRPVLLPVRCTRALNSGGASREPAEEREDEKPDHDTMQHPSTLSLA